MFSKTIIVVDKDVDVQNEAEVAWIVGTHYDPERDIQFTRGPVDDLEDASDLPAYGSKMGIDATRKWASEGFKRTVADADRRRRRGGAQGGRDLAEDRARDGKHDGWLDPDRGAGRAGGFGRRDPRDDAQLLLETPDLIAVGAIADDVRRRLHGAQTTFVRVFEVHVDAPAGGLAAAHHALARFRIVGTPSSLETAIAAVTCRRRARRGDVPVTGFSLADLVGASTVAHRSRRSARACTTQASTPLPTCRSICCRIRTSAVGAAQSCGLDESAELTTHAILPERRLRGKRARARSAGRRSAASARLRRCRARVSVASPTTGYDDVKQIAAARLLVTNIASIQVDWALYGPKLAQVALTMGADDVDGVSPLDPGTARHAAKPARGDPRQHPRGRPGAVERNGRFVAEITSALSRLLCDSECHMLNAASALSAISTRGRSCTGSSSGTLCSRCASTCRRSARRCCTRARSTSG